MPAITYNPDGLAGLVAMTNCCQLVAEWTQCFAPGVVCWARWCCRGSYPRGMWRQCVGFCKYIYFHTSAWWGNRTKLMSLKGFSVPDKSVWTQKKQMHSNCWCYRLGSMWNWYRKSFSMGKAKGAYSWSLISFKCRSLRTHGAIPPLPNTFSWRDT